MSRKIWGPRDEYREYLERAVELFPTMLKHVKVERIFLAGFLSRQSKFIAKIGGNKTPWAILLPEYDYCIQFWDPRFGKSRDSMKVYVCLHEMYHIPQGGFIAGGPEFRRLKTHDVEEFNLLISTYGINQENVEMVLKGEKALFRHGEKNHHHHHGDEIRRFPRLPKIK